MDIKRLIRNFIPSSLMARLRAMKQRRGLRRVATIACDATPLVPASQIEPNSLFDLEQCDLDWQQALQQTAALTELGGAQGVNPGDARAIFHLVRRLRPASVLEVGTHIGVSTAHLAAAMQANSINDSVVLRLVTVDIMDVNDPVSKPWDQFGAACSPAKLIERIGCSDFVHFETSHSTDFMASIDKRFDLIFLDGSHAADALYQEVPAALGLLNEKGVILLHDYYPNCGPLWSDGTVIPGPFLAVERLCSEHAHLVILPLGDLPWPTKLESNTTSLALLARRDA